MKGYGLATRVLKDFSAPTARFGASAIFLVYQNITLPTKRKLPASAGNFCGDNMDNGQFKEVLCAPTLSYTLVSVY